MGENALPLTAAILVGGLGTRLRPVVGARPKVLAEVAGRPFLSWILDVLRDVGVRRVVLCAGHRASEVFDAFGTAYRGVDIVHSEEQVPLGTGGALRFALPHLDTPTILAMNGDSWCDADLGAFVKVHSESRTNATLLCVEVPGEGAHRYGRVEADASGAVTRFIEKGGPATELVDTVGSATASAAAPAWISAGVYLLEREVIESIPPDRAVSIEYEVLPRWIGRGLNAHRVCAEFIDIGTPESFVRAQTMFAPRARGGP